MNNSQFALEQSLSEEKKVDPKPLLREREQKLLKILEALQGVQSSKEWSTLKTELFDSLSVSLKKELLNEAKKDDPSPMRLNRLAGELKWAEKFADLSKLEHGYKVELSNIRKNLYEHG